VIQNINPEALLQRVHDTLGNVEDMVSLAESSSWERFCIFDANLKNFIMTSPGQKCGWKCVDLEYAGWEDPALLCADTIAHMSWVEWGNSKSSFPWTSAHKNWLRAEFSGRLQDPNLPTRAATYEAFLLSYWSLVKTSQLLGGVLRMNGDGNGNSDAALAAAVATDAYTTASAV
jgi:hypothetical protein